MSGCTNNKTECILCGECSEDWIQCQKCEGWAHDECACVESGVLKAY
jgi:hypothetical protein